MMRKPVAQRQRPVHRFPFGHEPHDGMLALETLEPILHVILVETKGPGHDRRLEIDAMDACCSQHLPILIVEGFDLALHQAAHRRRQLPLERVQIRGHDPASVLLPDHLPAAQIAQEIRDKQRMPLGALMDQLRKPFGEGVPGELHRDVTRDRRDIERARRNLAALPVCEQIELYGEKRMPCLRKVRRTRRDDDHRTRVLHPLCEIENQIGGRRIGPVHIVEPQDDRLYPSGLFEQCRDFTFQPFLRAACCFGRQAGG